MALSKRVLQKGDRDAGAGGRVGNGHKGRRSQASGKGGNGAHHGSGETPLGERGYVWVRWRRPVAEAMLEMLARTCTLGKGGELVDEGIEKLQATLDAEACYL
jgi:hypothetical protein